MSNKDFEGKVALITGASRGIGRAIAVNLAANGASIAINYNKNEEAAIETKKLVDTNQVPSTILKANVADNDDVKKMINETEKKLGPIDLLVTNAGIAETEEVAYMSIETWKNIMAVNVDGTLFPILELIPGMTFTIEPMINAGKYETKVLQDGWTAVTKDKSLSAQFEHTVGITEKGYEIFTESAKGYLKPPYL